MTIFNLEFLRLLDRGISPPLWDKGLSTQLHRSWSIAISLSQQVRAIAGGGNSLSERKASCLAGC
jgi:hypothetical protein